MPGATLQTNLASYLKASILAEGADKEASSKLCLIGQDPSHHKYPKNSRYRQRTAELTGTPAIGSAVAVTRFVLTGT